MPSARSSEVCLPGAPSHVWRAGVGARINEYDRFSTTFDKCLLSRRFYFLPLWGRLLQLRVFGLGLLVDGDVRVGVFPESEKPSVSGSGFGGVTLQGVSAGEAEMHE
jgi:hypothetical protein